MSSIIQESVYEGNQTIDQDFNVDFFYGPESKILDMKFSANQDNILLLTDEGFKIYDLQQDKIIISEKNLSLGEIYSIDFFENSLGLIAIAIKEFIVIWDYNQRQIIKKFPLRETPLQISYCNPFIIIGTKSQNQNIILILNTRTDQAYRYLYIQNLNGWTSFANNINQFNCVLTYLSQQGSYLLIDFLHYQNLQGISIKTMAVMSDELIIDYQKQSLNKQQCASSSRLSSSLIYIQTCIAISDDSNLLAISPLVDNQKIYIFSIQPYEAPKLKYQLYRGQTKKMLSLQFGPNDMLVCISFQSKIQNNKVEATIHLYYKMKEIIDNQNKDQKSLTRLYFQTFSSENTHQNRMRRILLQIKKDKIQVFLGNNFKFEEQLQLDSNLVTKTIQNYIQWPKLDPY